MLRLKDLVELDTRGEFRSDVQLSDYDNSSLNLSLLQSYIFSTNVPNTFGASTQAVAALGLLDHLMRAFQYEKFENRFVAIANYGHGKSHLALVLANYFARPATSPEVQTIFKRIDHALNQPAKAQGYREFKEERGEFLVLRLRGDDPRPLREQFFRALKQALEEHEQTRGEELPFWVKQATQYLRGLTGEQLQKANDYLQRYTLDVPALLRDVEEYREQAFDRYVDLFAYLNHGIPPNLEGHVSLREAIDWVVSEFCNGGKSQLAGLLILFDEFSLYVQRYARDKAVGELQDLLQGIENHRRKAAFLAFAQHDPDEVATQALVGGQPLQNLKKELGRLPRRFALYSLMESVLDSYLKQAPHGWEQLLADREVKGLILGETTEVAWETFSKHYQDELGWTYEKFRDVVTRGCFPLHPMTTALLCHLKMEQGEGAARTVLGFVRDQLDFRAEQPAYHNGRVNWVLPTALVDYFEHRLAGDMPSLYQAFRSAMHNLEQVFGEQATDVHRSVLKALLLQEVGRLPLKRKQVELLAHLSGLDARDVLTALKELSDRNITQYDPVARLNRFWPAGTDPKRLEEAIREETERLRLEPTALVEELNKLFRDDPYFEFGSVKLDVEWGHSDDWAAQERIISADDLESMMVPTFSLNASGLQEGYRGVVAWMLLRDESERDGLRETARKYVEAQGALSGSAETPLPVIALIPKEPVPELEEFFIRLKALEAVGKRKDLLQEIGQQTYTQEQERTKAELRKALRQLRGNSESLWDVRRNPGAIVVPQAYQAAVAASGYGLSIKSVLRQLYDMAYRVRPPEFFTQYPASQTKGPNKLRSAVKTVAKNLLHDRIGHALSGMDNVARDLCEKYLVSKWGMLTPVRGSLAGSYALQKPASLKLQPAWDLLDRTFRPGAQDIPVKEVIPRLLNPPYGFDYNTATLLLCGWIGYHRSELLLSHRGARIGLGDLEQQIETTKTPRDFLNWACVNALAISRRDPDAALQEVQSIRARVIRKHAFSQEEARQAWQALDEFAAQDKQPPDVRQQAAEAADQLRNALDIAQKYDQKAKQILANLDNLREAPDLLKQRQELATLNSDTFVTIMQPAVNEIEQRILERLEQAIEREGTRVQTLTDITQVGAFENRLHTLEEQLEKQELHPLAQRVAAIEDALQERSKQLKAAEQEAAIQKEIDAMSVDAGLVSLYKYRQRLRDEMQFVSSQLKQARDRKLEAIEREIDRLETFAAGIIEEVRSVPLSGVQQIQKNIFSLQNRYTDTTHKEKLDQALDYLETLQRFRAEVQALEQRPLRSPQDVQNAEERLGEIEASFEQKLSAAHLAALEQARKSIASRVEMARQQAIHWLESRERELEQGQAHLGELQRLLTDPPAFLPADHQTRLDSLRARVQERLEQDYIAQIESLFLALGTPEKREECLGRLRRLIAEESKQEEHQGQ